MKNEREAFIARARDCVNFSALCREFGISRTTGYVWRSRSSSEELSRRPKSSPRRTPEGVESKILELRDANPAWGAKKLHELLKGTEGLPSVRTVGLRPLEDGEKVAVCYRNYRIATLETATDPLPARAIRRL